MLERVKRTIMEHSLIEPGGGVIVGFSGGADSTALVQALFELAPDMGFTLSCAHYNHGIRGDGAARDEEFVRGFCAERGIPLCVERGDVPKYAAVNGLSIETAARLLRYDFLSRVARSFGAGRIAVAHHMDDNAESLLLHLIRGSGLRGLTGMSHIRGQIIRPLLDIRRREIESFLEERGLSYCTDETNLLPDGSRNVLRLQIIPMIEAKLNPSFVEAVCGCAELNREDENWLSARAEAALDEARLGKGYDRYALARLPFPLRGRALRIALARCGAVTDIERLHVEKLMELLLKRSGAAIDLPHARVRISFDEVIFEGRAAKNGLPDGCVQGGPNGSGECGETVSEGYSAVFELRDGAGSLEMPFGRLTAHTLSPTERRHYRQDAAYLDLARLELPLTVRTRRAGDRFRPANAGGSRKLKDLFISKRLDQTERDRVPLLLSGGEIAFIPGFGIGDKFKITQETRTVLLIEYEKYGDK